MRMLAFVVFCALLLALVVGVDPVAVAELAGDDVLPLYFMRKTTNFANASTARYDTDSIPAPIKIKKNNYFTFPLRSTHCHT